MSFQYDAFGNRTSRTEDGATRSSVWNYALGLPSISIDREAGADSRYYVHTPGGALLYSIDAAGERRLHYHFDEAGNTTLITNGDGEIVAGYTYASYGEILAKTGEVENRFTYSGAFGVEREGGSGLYYQRARYYDSGSARFISRDPVRSLEPRSVNPYQYAGGNPTSFVDPDGRDRRSVRDLTLIDEQNQFFFPHEVARYVNLVFFDLGLGGSPDTGSESESLLRGISPVASISSAPQSEREAPIKLHDIAAPDDEDDERDSPFRGLRGPGAELYLFFAQMDTLGLRQIPEGLPFREQTVLDRDTLRFLGQRRRIDEAVEGISTAEERARLRESQGGVVSPLGSLEQLAEALENFVELEQRFEAQQEQVDLIERRRSQAVRVHRARSRTLLDALIDP